MQDQEPFQETVRSDLHRTLPHQVLGYAAEALLHDLWPSLTQGRARVTECACTDGRAVLLLRVLSKPERPLDARTAQVLERLLLGSGQKICALELERSVSSVTALAKRGLQAIGLTCLPSRVPLLLVMLAWAARVRASFPCVSVAVFADGEARFVALSMPALAMPLSTLSKAEQAVAALLVEGRCYSEIAARRGTSLRTVANQTAAVFHRLGISGRLELLVLIARSLSAAPRILAD